MNKMPQPLFQVFAKRKNSADIYCNIYVRVKYHDGVHEKSLEVRCQYEHWSSKEQTILNDTTANRDLKNKLEEVKQTIMGSYYVLLRTQKDFTMDEMLEITDGTRTPNSLSFCQCFSDVIARMEKISGRDGSSIATIEKHKRCLKYFKEFCLKEYGVSDLAFAKITRTTIDDLTSYIMVDCKCANNTTMKYMQIIKKIYRLGQDNGWVKVNAFSNYKFRMKTVARECLTEEELKAIVEKEFATPRLDYVRDMFVFSCYTGLAYIDIKNLRRMNIGEFKTRAWIKSRRTKTNIEASLPLLPAARRILDKRNPDWFGLMPNALLFDVISNQKLNEYLKEIADVCKINKPLTFHIARHTFATTVTLMNGCRLNQYLKC